MKNFTNNFKQLTSRLSARWLIMALMMLVGTSSAWAWTVYFDNSQTKWSNVYVVLGHDDYHRGDYKMTKVSNSDEIYYLTRDDWGDAKYITFSNSEIASGGTNKGFKTAITSGYDTFNNGASSLNHLFYSKVNNTISKNNDLYPRLVINCGLIGFYVGEYQDWGQSQFYVHSNGSGHISSYNTFNDGTTAKYGIIYAESKNYNVTHSTSWGGPTMGEKAILGKRYLITGDNSVSTAAGTTLSCTFNIDNTIKAGETSTASVTSSGKSKYGTKNYAVDSYYIKKSGESTLTKLTISGNELQTQSLEVGTYTIYVLLYDGKIYAKGAEQTLIIETACITPDAPFGGIAQSETICKGSTYEFDSNYKWYTGSTGETTVSGSEEINSNTDYYIVNVAPEGCESARTKYTINVDEPLVAPTLIPTNPTTCNGNHTAGSIVIENYANYSNEISFALYKDENPTGITYNNGFAISEGGDYKVVMTTTASNVCGQRVETEPISIEIVDVTPTVTPFEITKQANVCMGNPVTLSYDGTAQSGTISYAWYEGDSDVVLGTEETLTIQQAKNASYKLVVTVTSNDCPASAEATTTVEPKAVPSAPTFDDDAMDACVNQPFTLPMPNNLKYEEEPLWTVNEGPTTASQTINVAGEYTYTAYKNDGCPSQGTPFTVTVNPLPTINIGENVTAVLYEDVVLTATGNNIADVTWIADKGTITKDATDPKKAILTYDQAGEVTVTATATSAAGCTSVEATKTVTFSEEDCEPEIITQTNKTKVRVKKISNWSTIKIYAHSGQSTGSWPGVNMTAGTGEDAGYYVYTFESVSSNFKVIFNNGNSNGENQTVSGTATKGKVCTYTIGANSCSEDNNSRRCLTVTTTDYKTTGDVIITAPAVKMISAEYDEENDVIVANGAVYKTGCGVTFWGFQYSEDGQTWGDKETDYIRPISGNSLTVPGEFEYSFEIPNAGGGDIYYIRAYGINNYNKDNYSLNSAVFSETKIPVEIPSKTIESATISLVDIEGEPSDATEVCPQSTVYLKVSYVGGDFKDYEAADNFPGTNLELVNHDKAQNYAIFSYTATATGVANITISNDNTSITPTDGVSITLKNVTPVNAPMISISQGTICDTGSATITVREPVAGLSYTLYKETEPIAGPVIHDNGDLIFNVTEAGSYTVRAEESVCNNYANSMTVELKVVTSDVKIGLAVDKTTVNPWQPLKLTVTAPEGYAYTIVGLENVVYTQSGNVYTVKIPRPTDQDWPIKGNSGTPVKTKDVTFEAKIQVSDDLTCGSSSITVKLEDTEENCE